MGETRSKILLFFAGVLLTQSYGVRATDHLYRKPASEPSACVPDVTTAFRAIQTDDGRDFRIKTKGFFSGDSYTQRPWNGFGHDNHFQGIQAFRDPSHFVFSGAHRSRERATLFFARIDKNEKSAVYHSMNIGDTNFWHAGGISRFEDMLVVPVEAYKIEKKSRILFFDLTNPEAPVALPELTLKREHRDAGAVALNRLPDGRFVLLVYANGIVDLYASKTTSLSDGFDETAFVTQDWSRTPQLNGSSLNFVRQCDGKLFLVSMKNTGKAPPLFLNGNDYAGLASFEWNDGQPIAEAIEARHFQCGTKCNFAGATGAQVDEDGKLSLLSTYTFRNLMGTRVRMRIFE